MVSFGAFTIFIMAVIQLITTRPPRRKTAPNTDKPTALSDKSQKTRILK